MRFLFTSNPLIGHVLPMLPLMHAARDAGHEVVVATGAEMIANLQARGFTTWSAGPSFADTMADLQRASEQPAASQEEKLGRDAMHLFARPSVGRALDLIPRAVAWRPDIVVSEITEFAGREVASATGALPITHGFGTHVPNLGLFADVIFEHLSTALGAPNRRRDLDTGIYLDPCPPGLQSDELIGTNVWPIRPITGRIAVGDRLPTQFLELPDRPVVYVTLGTVVNTPALLSDVLDAVEDLPISLAVTTGPGVDPSELGTRPANVAVAEFVPQALILPYVSAVVSHTGSGTMLGALAAGVPQVCLPRGADQFANADRVRETGAGIRLLPDEVTPERLRSAVQAVLDDPTYARAARSLQAEIKAMPTAERVLEDLVAMAVPEARSA